MHRLISRSCVNSFFKVIFIRNLHLSETNFIFWRKLRKLTEDKRILEDKKLSQTSSELFEISKSKVNDLTQLPESASDEFIRKLIFEEAILIYMQRFGKTRRGHIQFIDAALKKMKEYGVQRSLPTYKKILEIFPEVKMIPKSFWQTEFFHYPRQQECALDILVAMEENYVIPDEDFGRMLYKRFGLHTSPMVRYQRMMYWMPKFKNANPWPVPHELPKDPLEVARLALTRINPEKETKVTLMEVQLNEFEKTWLVHGQSDVQKKLISYLKNSFQSNALGNKNEHERVVYVDGPQQVWIRNQSLNYYMLSTEVDKARLQYHEALKRDQIDESQVKFDNWYTSFDPDTQFPTYFGNSKPSEMLPAGLTQYEDDLDNRTVLATCIIGNESIASLRMWVNMLIRDNPGLDSVKIVFRLQSRLGELTVNQQ